MLGYFIRLGTPQVKPKGLMQAPTQVIKFILLKSKKPRWTRPLRDAGVYPQRLPAATAGALNIASLSDFDPCRLGVLILEPAGLKDPVPNPMTRKEGALYGTNCFGQLFYKRSLFSRKTAVIHGWHPAEKSLPALFQRIYIAIPAADDDNAIPNGRRTDDIAGQAFLPQALAAGGIKQGQRPGKIRGQHPITDHHRR
jgi:hypothetical protein